jgi:hypothetical protein
LEAWAAVVVGSMGVGFAFSSWESMEEGEDDAVAVVGIASAGTMGSV